MQELQSRFQEAEELQDHPDELQQAIQRLKEDMEALRKAIMDALGPVVRNIIATFADAAEFLGPALQPDGFVWIWLENQAPPRWLHLAANSKKRRVRKKYMDRARREVCKITERGV